MENGKWDSSLPRGGSQRHESISHEYQVPLLLHPEPRSVPLPAAPDQPYVARPSPQSSAPLLLHPESRVPSPAPQAHAPC